MAPRLWRLVLARDQMPFVRHHAAWALARWYALEGNWETVRTLLLEHGGIEVAVPGLHGPLLLAIDAACRTDSCAQAGPLLERLQAMASQHPDRYLAQANLAGAISRTLPDAEQRVLKSFNELWSGAGLCSIRKREAYAPLTLDNLAASLKSPDQTPLSGGLQQRQSAEELNSNVWPDSPQTAHDLQPLVSVIVPAFNAEETVATTLRSLFEQSWRALEIIIVDDASTDATAQVLLAVCECAPAHQVIRVLRHANNRGAYAARNTGLEYAGGSLITTQDADDWAHPQRIEQQVRSLLAQPAVVASVCYGVRLTSELHVSNWSVTEHWTEVNLSSLMVRRSALSALGYWDEVRVGADSELYERLRVRFGPRALIETQVQIPLGFSRLSKDSLTQGRGETHLCSHFVGARKDYQDLFRRWHQRQKTHANLHLMRPPARRAFPIPNALRTGQQQAQIVDPLDAIQVSGWFDPIWYPQNHLDLQGRTLDPLEHFWEQGLAEGRDPSPHFSTSGYLTAYPAVRKSGQHPLLHYLRLGRHKGYQRWPVFPGERRKNSDWPTLLFCGHQANRRVFGAERALADLLASLVDCPVNLVVVLPRTLNQSYLETLRRYAIAVAVFPYGWWQQGRPLCSPTLRNFRALIDYFQVDRVHVNTVVLAEPLQAARDAGIPVWLHLHELPTHDTELCDTLGATPVQLGNRVLDMVDRVLANSRATATWLCELRDAQMPPELAHSPPIEVFRNPIDLAPFLALPLPPLETDICRIGMISSNQPKKGLADFERLAERLGDFDPSLQCILIGPPTDALSRVLQRQSLQPNGGNIHSIGYVDDLANALRSLDILVNLSQVQESFGRTLIEAMAAARPVVVYDWGALSEHVDHGINGYLAPYRDVDAVAHCIMKLADDRAQLIAMGMRGRAQVELSYGRAAQQRALRCLLSPDNQHQISASANRYLRGFI
ncbi:glycosyltransferase [Halochromatium roseum]|uniref:glycosyltransferase n=1 Tax=Halochromatium roseum TaxID=391920 RepID=UPI001914A5B4|nr:glycosyltransferase [Halochromatium roseum]